MKMITRELGRTGQMSTILTLGGYALGQIKQKEADSVIELAIKAGINQVDVAPSYMEAEKRLGSWFGRHGNPFFSAVKPQNAPKRLHGKD
jgi:aryl-alcohol dehydrogenase-like predicted oxidoreductase